MPARRIALALSAFYLAVETLYVLRLPLISDEFGNAAMLIDCLSKVPYRDFTPYKTVLGYYLQAPLLGIASSNWTGLMLVKLEAAVLTAGMIYAGARVLFRHFDSRAVLLSLGLFVINSTFLERSGDLRVDMLTSIAGFIGFLFLLEERHALAGLLTALSFFVSQKGAYYIVAAELALLVWLIQSRDFKRVFRAAIAFNCAAVAVGLAYAIFWSVLASPAALFETVAPAVRVAVMPYVELPQKLHAMYWPQILSRDGALWVMAVAGLIVAAMRLRRRERKDAIVLGYGAFILGAAIWHKQPWPYFFVLIIPTLFVAAIPAFEALIAYCRRSEKKDVRRFAIALYAAAVLLSLSRLPVALSRSNASQRRTIHALEQLLQPGDGYFAGMNVLYRPKQAIQVLSWFEQPFLEYLHAAPPSLHAEYIRELERSRVKFVVHTLFIDKLPPPLRAYLREHYAHLWSHIYVYAPMARSGRAHLRFDGRYQLRALRPQPAANVTIDGRAYKIGDVVTLRSGWHELAARDTIRLALIPEGSERLDRRYRQMPDRFIPVEFYRW